MKFFSFVILNAKREESRVGVVNEFGLLNKVASLFADRLGRKGRMLLWLDVVNVFVYWCLL